jgi:hypothetical protein
MPSAVYLTITWDQHGHLRAAYRNTMLEIYLSSIIPSRYSRHECAVIVLPSDPFHPRRFRPVNRRPPRNVQVFWCTLTSVS